MLALLLAVHALARSVSQSDDVARALTFTVLVIANLALIHVNRSWSSRLKGGRDTPNRFFRWIAFATLALLVCVLGIPAVGRLFAFAPLTPGMLLSGAGAVGVAWVWFEGVKWASDRAKGRML